MEMGFIAENNFLVKLVCFVFKYTINKRYDAAYGLLALISLSTESYTCVESNISLKFAMWFFLVLEMTNCYERCRIDFLGTSATFSRIAAMFSAKTK